MTLCALCYLIICLYPHFDLLSFCFSISNQDIRLVHPKFLFVVLLIIVFSKICLFIFFVCRRSVTTNRCSQLAQPTPEFIDSMSINSISPDCLFVVWVIRAEFSPIFEALFVIIISFLFLFITLSVRWEEAIPGVAVF